MKGVFKEFITKVFKLRKSILDCEYVFLIALADIFMCITGICLLIASIQEKLSTAHIVISSLLTGAWIIIPSVILIFCFLLILPYTFFNRISEKLDL